MMNADGIIFVSPAYANNVTGLMKNFIDRFAYVGHRPNFFNQCPMLVATTGYTEKTLNTLSYLVCGDSMPQ
jgi:multimeric flavodoxin WrbA